MIVIGSEVDLKEKTLTVTLNFKERQDVLDLIADLRITLKRSERNGGQYGCHRRAGRHTVIFDMQLK